MHTAGSRLVAPLWLGYKQFDVAQILAAVGSFLPSLSHLIAVVSGP